MSNLPVTLPEALERINFLEAQLAIQSSPAVDSFKTCCFADVAVGAFFKEAIAGPWHLKMGRTTSEYCQNGSRYAPAFQGGEQVFVS